MSLFGSLLGGGISLLGSALSKKQAQGAGQAAFQGAQGQSMPMRTTHDPRFITGQMQEDALSPQQRHNMGIFQGQVDPGESFFLPPHLQQQAFQRLENLGQEDLGDLENQFFSRLQNQARPGEERLRASTRANVFGQGRLGLSVGGGQTGAFNPELASLNEGLARAQFGRRDTARSMAERDQSRRFGIDSGLIGILSGLRQERQRSQLAASGEQRALMRTPQAFFDTTRDQMFSNPQAGQLARAGMQGARSTESFFAGLGQGVADSGFFGGGSTGGQALPMSPGVFGPQ